MQNLITSQQMHKADAYAIANQPISSIDLMEKAAYAFVKVFKKEIKDKETSIAIFCGKGNNGGDGLAIARLLLNDGYKKVIVYLVNFSTKTTNDYLENLRRLKKSKLKIITVNEPKQVDEVLSDVIIDAILGSGLNKPLTAEYENLASKINCSGKRIIAVDVPTGLNTEGIIPEKYNGIKSNLTVSFQRPKINFFFPESAQALAKFKIVDIGLDESFIQNLPSDWKLITAQSIADKLKPREKFSHKGTFGHALLIAGNNATMGAALLSASATLHSGSGLTTVCLPKSGLAALNTALPEVMALIRHKDLIIDDLDKYTAIGIGPGLGREKETEKLFNLVLDLKKSIVIDADALNILGENKQLFSKLAPGTILTPHLKEFDRLFGEHKSWWERVSTAQKEAKSKKLIIVLKNQYTFVCLPTGEICINSTGNPAMASGGMGDVLTGIITSFLAQGYSSADAAILGVYLHGRTGDKLAKKKFVVIASEVARGIAREMRVLSR